MRVGGVRKRTIGPGVVVALVMAGLLSLVVASTAGRASGTTPLPVTVYVASELDGGVVTPIDAATGVVGTPISVGQFPDDIALDPAGSTAYVAVWSGAVVPIDVATNTARDPIPVIGATSPPRWAGIAITPDGTAAYTSNSAGRVTPIDLTTEPPMPGPPIETFVGAHRRLAITPDGSTALFGDFNLQRVAVVDLGDGSVETLTGVVRCGVALDIEITPDGTTAWVAGAYGVTPLDLTADPPACGASIPLDATTASRSLEITPDGSTLYATSMSADGRPSVTPVDLGSRTAGTPIPYGDPISPMPGFYDRYGEIALTSDGKVAFVTNAAENSVTPIDLATATVGSAISLGPPLEPGYRAAYRSPTAIVVTPGSIGPANPDADGDGVSDTLEVAGVEGAFSDADPPVLGQGTFGQVVETNGLDVLVADASPGGVTITTSGPGGPAQFTLCAGALSVSMGTNSTATFTCGSLTVSEVSGAPVTVSLGGRFVRFPAGTAGTVATSASGGIVFADVVGSGVTLSKGRLAGPVPVGDSALIESDSRNSTVSGTAGNDLIFDSGGNNSIMGGGGHDTIVTDSGNDSIEGGDGDDWIDAGDGKNKVSGGAGNDTVTTGSGADAIDGGPGADTCNAGGGKNSVTSCP